MSIVALWALVVGAVFFLSALGRSALKGWPLSMPPIYLLVGIGISPWEMNLLNLHPVDDAGVIEVLSEIGVLVSLLTAGLKIAPAWQQLKSSAFPIASIGMTITVFGVAALGVFGMGLSWGAAILLGAVLAPTDPVLASAVQLRHEDDRGVPHGK